MNTKTNEHGSQLPLTVIIEGKEFEWPNQHITGKELRKLGSLPEDADLFMGIADPWDDEAIGAGDTVDLAREGVEAFYVRKALPLTVNDKQYSWKKQYITGSELRKLASLAAEDEIVLLLQKPYEDEVIEEKTRVDLARPGIEHFRVRKKDEEILVTVRINDKPYDIKRGVHTVAELKKKGGVPATDELAELIDKKLVPLADNASVHVKGCEEFFSCKREGSSS